MVWLCLVDCIVCMTHLHVIEAWSFSSFSSLTAKFKVMGGSLFRRAFEGANLERSKMEDPQILIIHFSDIRFRLRTFERS